MDGDPKYDASQDIPDYPVRALCRRRGPRAAFASTVPRTSARLGRGACGRPSDDPRHLHRPRRAAAAAARHVQAGARVRRVAGEGRSGRARASSARRSRSSLRDARMAAQAMKRRRTDRRISVSAYTIPTDAPESDGTLEWDADDAGAGGSGGRRRARHRLQLREPRDRDIDRRHARQGRRRPRCARRGRRVGRDGGRDPQSRPPRHRVDGDRRRRQRAVGSQGAPARRAARAAARGCARRDSRVRQRRLHVVLARAADRAARWLGARRHRHGQDEDRPRSCSRHRARACCRATRSVRTRRSSSTPTARTAASRRSASPRRIADLGVTWFEEPVVSDDLEGLAADPRSRAGADGHRRRRIRLRHRVLPAHVRGGRGRRAAGRRDALRGHHRVHARCRRSPRRSICRCRAIARRRSTCIRAARRARGISNISTITCASSGCSSTVRSSRWTARCIPRTTAPASA